MKAIVIKGGPGSGHWGHCGVEGQVGGSLPGTICLSLASGPTAPARRSRIRVRSAIKKQEFYMRDEYYRTGVTDSALVGIIDDRKAIIKKQDTWYPAEEFDSTASEEAVYELSQVLGWDGLVPYTDDIILKKGLKSKGGVYVDGFPSGENVSIQLWIDDAEMYMNWARAVHGDTPLDQRSFSRAFMLDVISGNVDRHGWNMIVTPDGKAIAIDNNRSFSPVSKSFTSIDEDFTMNFWNPIKRKKYGWENRENFFEFHPDDINAFRTFRYDMKTGDNEFSNYIRREFSDETMYSMYDRMDMFLDMYDKGHFDPADY